jgi:thiol-disulfide isomerase/thioredoxin
MRILAPPALIVGLLMLSSCAAEAAPKIQWGRSYSDALAQSKKTGRLIIADFYTDWCTYCKVMDEQTMPDARVVKLVEKLVPVKLNAEKEGRQVAMRWGVTSYPSILLFTPSGELAGRIEGFAPPDEFLQQVQQILNREQRLPTLAQRSDANPGDVMTAAQLALIYAQRGNPKRAMPFLARLEKGDPKNETGKLALVYNQVGSAWGQAGQPVTAMGMFQKAIKSSRNEEDRAQARVFVAATHLQLGKKKDAVATLNGVLKDPKTPVQAREVAETLLEGLKNPPTPVKGK